MEFDIQFTADGCPVVFHDETLKRMAGAACRIRDYPASILAGFDIGFLHGPEFRGERIPLVEEVAAAVPPHVGLHAELKDFDVVTSAHLARLFAAFEANGGLSRVTFSSPHEETLDALRHALPTAKTALLLFRAVRVPTDAARRAAYLGCVSVHPDVSLVSTDLVEICHRHGMKVFVFTVNERSAMRRLLPMGVDGFFTDYPDRLSETQPPTAPSPQLATEPPFGATP